MATKVFISWSGQLSNKLAESIRQWLPGVLQFVRPYFTPSDIEKGARWGSDILSELSSSDIGIICLTRENLHMAWILFEAGALSKNFEKSRVCTLLFGIDTTDLTGPLTIFQNTRFEKSDFKKLVKTINSAGGESKLDDSVVDRVFEMWWPKLEQEVTQILEHHKHVDSSVHRSERDILEEILELTRLNSRRIVDPYIAPGAIEHLVDTVTELRRSIAAGDFENLEPLLERLDRPVSYLSSRVNPRLWKGRQAYRRRGLLGDVEIKEEKDEGDDDV